MDVFEEKSQDYQIPIDYESEKENNESDPQGPDLDIDASASQAEGQTRETDQNVRGASREGVEDARKQEVETPRQNLDSQECLQMLQRLKAEFDNYRKRVQKEREQIYDYVRGEVFKSLLPVIDDLERLLNSEASEETLRQGVEMIYKNLMAILRSHGLEAFTDRGNPFDPNVHEAVSVEETEENLDGKIVDTWLKGYRHKGRLLRPAKVKVGRKK